MHRRHTIFAIILFLFATVAAHSQDAVKVGDRIGKLEFTDIRSLPRTLDDFGAKKAFVLVFTSASCPLVQRYLPTLKAIEENTAARKCSSSPSTRPRRIRLSRWPRSRSSTRWKCPSSRTWRCLHSCPGRAPHARGGSS